MRWDRGQLIVRREVLRGRPWLGLPAHVVGHSRELLAIYVPEGSPFGFAAGDWPTENGRHPYDGVLTRWQGPGCLHLQRPGEAYAVWRLGHEDGSLARWYLNLQAPFAVHGHYLDTLDHELDVVVEPGSHVGRIKDAEKVDESARRGRFDTAQAERIHRQGDDLLALVRAGDHWWEPWRTWEPDPSWAAPDTIPDGWDA
ncbi:MAG TPA: DUF402 domain-containing protein [Acidimicrobiales bacterium]|nr:DUF402 domain-containing protein [Acidimicrobiales bacterium]